MHRRLAATLATIAVALAASTAVCADIVWPALLLESRLLSLWAIPAGLLAEFAFLRWWLDFGVRRSILADALMNAASAAFGLIALPIVGFVWELTIGGWLNDVFQVGTFNPGAWLATCVFAVLINTGIEWLVLKEVFTASFTRSRVAGLGLANLVSVGLAMVSLRIAPLHL